MDETWKTIAALTGAFVVLVGAIGGFFRWHFNTVNGLKDEIHKLEVQLTKLEGKYDSHQILIDRLSELYPIFNKIIENMVVEHPITKKGK